MRIRIIKTPPGAAAPEEIRAKWVGMEVDSLGRENADETGRIRVGRENLGGYQVDGRTAFMALATHSPEAYEWWKKNASFAMFGTLVFRAEVCEEVP